MNEDHGHGTLILPSLKGHIGDRFYYAAIMKMRDVAARVSIASDIHRSTELSRLIQREIEQGHANKIVSYLLSNPERFFNALVIGVYDGDPEWFELDVGGNEEYPEGPGDGLDGIVGYLRLNGNEKLFPIDGQHRLVGIQKSVAAAPDRGDEEIVAILVAHKVSTEGEQRTRRLFTTLNRYAKQVSVMEKIALDEDDVIAITTRRLMEDSDLLRDRLSISKGKSMPVSDRTHITTVAALYDALDFYLKPNINRGWSVYKRTRPDDTMLDDYYARAAALWQQLNQHIPELSSYFALIADATPYRHAAGGHLLFRPVGLDVYFRTVRLLENSGVSVANAVERVASVPQQLGDEPWISILWSPRGRMLTDSVNQRIARALMLQLAGGNLAAIRMTGEELDREIAGLKGIA